MAKLFEELREQLLVAGIAPRHVRRYLAELNDHLADLRAEGHNAAAALARLGTADELAKPMLARPDLRSLASRYPRAVFGFGPVVLWLGLTIGTVFFIPTPWLERILQSATSAWTYGITYAVMFGYLRILPTALAAIAVVSAARQRSSLLLPGIGAAIVLIFSCTCAFTVTPPTPGHSGEIQITCSLIPFLVPFTDVLGPMDGMALFNGLVKATGVLVAIMGITLFWTRRQQQTEGRHAEAV